MVRAISSSGTIFYKFLFGPVWILMIAGITLLAFFPQIWSTEELATPLPRTLLLLALVVSLALYLWLFAPLKRVELMSGALRISNYTTTIEVPLKDVSLVSGSVLLNPELIWIRFKDPTEFGDKIVFMGRYRFFGGYSIHPIVKELEQEIAAHR